MKRGTFRTGVSVVAAIYAIAILYFFYVLWKHPEWFDRQKEFIPLIVALPATWLTYAFQARSSMSSRVRDVWNEIAAAVQASIDFVTFEPRTDQERRSVMTKLRTVGDYLRAIFIEQETSDRYYASRYVDSICEIVRGCPLIGPDSDNMASRISEDWKNVRQLLLPETSLNAGWYWLKSSKRVPQADLISKS